MLLTNHVLTGTLLGLIIDQPTLLAPTAVASHLALDMTPHFGFRQRPRDVEPDFRSHSFLLLGSIDFIISCSVVISACLIWPQRLPQILVGTIGAALPDLTYIPIIVFGKKRIYRIPGYRRMIDALAHIQWYERPPGLVTELVWMSTMTYLIAQYL